LDSDRDGLVSKEQVIDLIYSIDPEMTEKEMENLLNTVDLNGKQQMLAYCICTLGHQIE